MMNNDELKSIVEELYHMLWKMWDIWKEIAIGSLLVVENRIEYNKRRNIRLFVGIAEAREGKSPEEKHWKSREK
jgi:hypothetical protein